MFPVGGTTTIGGPFGSFRADTGAHQGNDLFADFGTPVVAVADGTVANVGSLPISGNRLWVYADGGDQFFYAHLSAFAPAAVNDRHVEAGTILGYVGNTGDAEPTPPHLHFEIHPNGGDAVDPEEFLTAWQKRAGRPRCATPPSARAPWSRSATSSERDEPSRHWSSACAPSASAHLERPRIVRAAFVSAASRCCWPGIAMLVLPGPAFAVIPIALAILSLEFAWAGRLLEKALEQAEKAKESAKQTLARPADRGGGSRSWRRCSAASSRRSVGDPDRRLSSPQQARVSR